MDVREEFLNAVAHDLKSPLTTIRGHAQLARRRLARLSGVDTAPVAAHLAQIDVAVTSLVGMVDELLDMTRAQAGEPMVLNRHPTDLLALARGVVAQYDGLSGHSFSVQSDAGAIEATVDTARLERVFGNLLSNAIRYSPNGGDIVVRVGQREVEGTREAVIVVEDQGIGIPAVDLPHIFERFHRGSNVADQFGGSGIGLASALRIAQAHGGDMAVESKEGIGTAVTVRLPLGPSGRAQQEGKDG